MSIQPFRRAGVTVVKNLKFPVSSNIKILIKAADKPYVKKYQDSFCDKFSG